MMDGSDIVAAELARRAKGQEAVRAAEAAAAAEATAKGSPPLVYHVVRPLEHNGTRFEIGDEFSSPDEAAVKALREANCLRLPTELEPAEATATRLARLELENATQAAEAEELRARVAELEAAAEAAAAAAAATAPKGAGSGKGTGKAEKPAEA